MEKELYGLQFTNESRGDSMWKNFGLPCGKKAYRVGKKKEKSFKLGSKKKLVMHGQLNMTNEIGGVLLLTGHQH